MKTKLTLGFSHCPNDCFIFDALVHKKIDTENLDFEVHLADVEELNKRATSPPIPLPRKKRDFQQRRAEYKQLDITKLSFAAYAFFAKKNYDMLESGAALGFGVGPLLISKSQIPNPPAFWRGEIPNFKIAIPGKFTTANFLFSLAFPNAKNKVEMLFSEIEDAVLQGKVDAGVIIHENRFTYEQKGLKKIIDLGEWWEKKTNSPIPLGGIFIKKNIPEEIKKKVNRLIRKSVEFAFANPKSSLEFVRKNAQEMNEEVMYKHISLYVNNFSVDLGNEGKKAVEIFLKKAEASRELH